MKPAGWVAGFAAFCAASLAAGAETAHVNRLASEASPYLQLHAHNPVDWYPWGEEAFARAKAEDKPIFLSVGYSTCYWCHVMEREVFSNAAIAKLMNQHLISIKVDREERPDIDDVYMQATQLLTRRGGWPNSVFLTLERKPFFAGTYFPSESISFNRHALCPCRNVTHDRNNFFNRAFAFARFSNDLVMYRAEHRIDFLLMQLQHRGRH